MRRSLCVLGSALGMLLACGDNTPPPQVEDKEDPKVEEKQAEPQPKLDVPAADDTAGAAEDGEDWGSEEGAEEAAGEEAGAVEAVTAYPGPCKLTWSTGAVLQFKYTETGGTVRVDEDGDRKSETCGAFTSADGKTTEMKVDEGCDKKNDLTISPKYDDKANVATATFSTTKDGAKTEHAVTLVTIPGFTGLTPGYPLYAARDAAGVKVSKGLVKSADVKEPWDGPAMKVSFTYDKDGRVTRIKEDHERDGSTDRRFDYKYDDAGNVTRITVVIGSGEAEQKGTAKLNYTCHQTP